MTKKLISIVAVPLILGGISGCFWEAPVIKKDSIKEIPPPQKRQMTSYAQLNYPQACDCFTISMKVEDMYKDLKQLKEIEDSSLEELQKNPNDTLERKYLESSLMLKRIVIKKKNEMIQEGKIVDAMRWNYNLTKF